MSQLVPCPHCGRHLRIDETRCVFCSAAVSFRGVPPPALPRTRLNRAQLFAFGAALAGAVPGACTSKELEDSSTEAGGGSGNDASGGRAGQGGNGPTGGRAGRGGAAGLGGSSGSTGGKATGGIAGDLGGFAGDVGGFGGEYGGAPPDGGDGGLGGIGS